MVGNETVPAAIGTADAFVVAYDLQSLLFSGVCLLFSEVVALRNC